jgi:hypothetical protein
VENFDDLVSPETHSRSYRKRLSRTAVHDR